MSDTRTTFGPYPGRAEAASRPRCWPAARVFSAWVLVLSAWAVLGAAATVMTAMLRLGEFPPFIVLLVACFTIGSPDLDTLAGWIGVVASVAIGGVGAVLLLKRSLLASPWPFAVGLAAGEAVMASTMFAGATGGLSMTEALQFAFAPIALYGIAGQDGFGPLMMLTWQGTTVALILWTLTCATCLVRNLVLRHRQPTDAALSDAAPVASR